MAQAAYEAVAVQLAQINRRLDTGLAHADRLVASGAALLRSPRWMQMTADAAGRPVVASRHPRYAQIEARQDALYRSLLVDRILEPA